MPVHSAGLDPLSVNSVPRSLNYAGARVTTSRRVEGSRVTKNPHDDDECGVYTLLCTAANFAAPEIGREDLGSINCDCLEKKTKKKNQTKNASFA